MHRAMSSGVCNAASSYDDERSHISTRQHAEGDAAADLVHAHCPLRTVTTGPGLGDAVGLRGFVPLVAGPD